MKDSAIFINCGRGKAVASDVLYQVLHDRKIAAAGIDVTEFEPLPSDSPLWERDAYAPTIDFVPGMKYSEDTLVRDMCSRLQVSSSAAAVVPGGTEIHKVMP